jgi:ferric-dicitrate binding protein FerR (iron transport regulator)
MKLLMWYRGRKGNKKTVSDAVIEKALLTIRTQVHAADPDTTQRWRYLNAVLPSASRSGKEGSRRRIAVALKPALALIAFVLVVGAVASLLLTRTVALTYATTRGQQTDVVMADSTRVTLNHTSTLVVNRLAPKSDRSVTLDGEAFFDVRQNGTTFEVVTSVGTVRVLGTEFNVRVRNGKLEVAVVRGTVRVSARDTTTGPPVILTAGTLTTCFSGGSPDGPEAIPFADYPGWMRGKIQFRRSPLASVAAEIAARFDVDVTIAEPSVQSQTLTGSLDARSAETAVRTLCQLTGLRYRNDANGYSLY